MKYLTILFIVIIIISAKCREDKDCHDTISIINNSDKVIFYNISSNYPDTLSLANNPFVAGTEFEIEKQSIGKDIYRDCIEYKFKINSKLIYFIYDAQVLATTPWDTVVKKYLILKRYDLSLQDMQKSNWTITYP